MPYKEYFFYCYADHRDLVSYPTRRSADLRRVFEHKQKSDPKSFTRKYQVNQLMWFETHNDVNEAISREKLIKKWKRRWKVELIEKENPEWNDLSADWYD